MPVSVLSKWGNSLALRVPGEVSGNFKAGDHFEVYADESGLHFRKARQIKKYDIKDVLETLPQESQSEMDWGRDSGKEIC